MRARILKGKDYKGRQEQGRFYRCVQCGSLVDSFKVIPSSGTGADSKMETVPSEKTTCPSNFYFDAFDCIGTLEVYYSGDGSVRDKKHITAVEITGGCPFCGCLNYKGD